MVRRLPLLAAMALVACDGACDSNDTTLAASSAAPSAASAPSRLAATGRIAFVRERDEQKRVFVLDLATGEASPLVTRDFDLYPGPGLHGDLLLVSAEDRGELHREQLWRWHEGALTKLGEPGRMVRHPSWLPDGSGVVFESSRDAFRDLYLTTADGTVRLTESKSGAFEPSVHPAGDRVAYVSSDEGNAEVFVRPLPGHEGQPRRLTWSKGDDKAPRWSPDGATLAWVSVRGGTGQVFVMDADGRHPRALAPSERDQADPRWSPDGTHVAFVERREGRQATVVVARSSGERVFDTGGASVDEGPAWSPDGRHVAFSSDRTGDPELHVVSLDGTVHRLTESPGPDWLPRWLE